MLPTKLGQALRTKNHAGPASPHFKGWAGGQPNEVRAHDKKPLLLTTNNKLQKINH